MAQSTNECKILGSGISRIRRRKRMSAEDLASAARFDYSGLRKIESGKGNPTLKTICKIANGLGVSPAAFWR